MCEKTNEKKKTFLLLLLSSLFQVRDDLQSAKQMLALELRSKEALERENKRLSARVTNLQEELKDKPTNQGPTRSDTDQQVHYYYNII